MIASLTYSVLKYHHSLVLGEAINVGIIFYFLEEERLEFVAGNSNRIKSIYPDFDQTVYNYLIKSIERKVCEVKESIFSSFISKTDFKKYINSSILPEDATVLQFSDPTKVSTTIKGADKIIDDLSRVFLPGIITKKPEVVRHNESFLIKKFVSYISDKDKALEKKLIRNKTIHAEVNHTKIELKFDFAWQNGSTNLIKPLSFDLSDEQSIQNKSTQYFGYLNLLTDYSKKNNLRFDFLVSKPQNKDLVESYETALNILELSDAPKRIITEADIQNYSDEAIYELLTH